MEGLEERARTKIRQVVETYDAIAEGFSSTRRTPWHSILQLLGDLSNGTILDVGCGNARHLVELAKRASLAIGVDLSRRLIEVARLRIKRLNVADKSMLVLSDLLFMPFRDSSFDCILCVAVLHHIPTKGLRRRAVLEIMRVLKKGGVTVISAWYRWQKRLLLSVLKSALMRLTGTVFEFGDTYIPWRSKGRTYKRFYHLFTLKEMRELLNIRDLEIRELRILTIGSKKWMNVVAIASKR